MAFTLSFKVTAFTRPVRTMKHLGQTREASEEWQQMVTSLCGPLWFWAGSHQSSGIRHNSCHAQISDIFSSSVACVTLATPLRQQMARPTLVCALPNTNPVLVFFRALGFFPTCGGGAGLMIESSRLFPQVFFWHFWRLPLTPFYSNHWSSPLKIPQVLSRTEYLSLAAAWGQHAEPCEALDADYVPCLKTNFLKQGSVFRWRRCAVHAAGLYY